MYFEQALEWMRKGCMITRGIPGEKFRLYEGHFEIINDDYPNGCHTNVPGDDLSSDRWELANTEIYYERVIDRIDLSVRCFNCLKKKFGTENMLLGEIVRCSMVDFIRLPRFGQKCLKELKSELNRLGLTFSMELSESQLQKLEQIRKSYKNEL